MRRCAGIDSIVWRARAMRFLADRAGGQPFRSSALDEAMGLEARPGLRRMRRKWLLDYCRKTGVDISAAADFGCFTYRVGAAGAPTLETASRSLDTYLEVCQQMADLLQQGHPAWHLARVTGLEEEHVDELTKHGLLFITLEGGRVLPFVRNSCAVRIPWHKTESLECLRRIADCLRAYA